MAIAFINDASGSDTDATIPATVPAGGWPAGTLLAVGVTIGSDATSLSSVTDTGLNTYTILNGGATLHGAGENQSAAFAWSLLTTPLSAGDTAVGNLSGADGGSIIVSAFSGLSATPYDDDAVAESAFGTDHTSGTTTVTTQNDELVVGYHSLLATLTAWTADGTYTVNDNQTFFGSWRQVAQHKIVAVQGAYESNGSTAPTSCRVFSFVATFKADLGGGPPDVQTRRYQIRRSRMTSW